MTLAYDPQLREQIEHDTFGGKTLWHETDRGPWQQTAYGGRSYALTLGPDDINLADMIVGMSKICRYGGQIPGVGVVFTVAQHSVMGSFVAEDEHGRDVARQFLLHDAPEYVIGDMVRPLKYALPDYVALEHRIWRDAFAPRFGLPATLDPAVKKIDNFMIAWEKRDLLPHSEEWGGMPEVHEDWPEILPQGPRAAYHAFVARFVQLFPEFAEELDGLPV